MSDQVTMQPCLLVYIELSSFPNYDVVTNPGGALSSSERKSETDMWGKIMRQRRH